MTPPKRRRLSDRRLASVVYVARSSIHGRGLFAARAIAADEYIGTFHGPRVSDDGCHVLWVYPEKGAPIGRVGRNLMRFLNHATPYSAAFQGFDLYACRAIQAGEEITIDYAEAE